MRQGDPQWNDGAMEKWGNEIFNTRALQHSNTPTMVATPVRSRRRSKYAFALYEVLLGVAIFALRGNLAGTCGAELHQRKHGQRARKCCAADPIQSHGPSSSCAGGAEAEKEFKVRRQLWQVDLDPEDRCRRFDRA